MDTNVKVFLIITSVVQCTGVSLRRQLEHIAKTQFENQGYIEGKAPSRRNFYKYDPRELSNILGVPSMPSHLPEAEPILPGHTLIKPALGMLKSSVKFPHKDLDDGAGVYGNYENIGIRYDSKNERVLYTGFRRMPYNDIFDPDPKLRSNNKISLYLNDNKEPRNRKKANGQIYLKRIYLSIVPKNFNIIGIDLARNGKIRNQSIRYLREADKDENDKADLRDAYKTDAVNSMEARLWNYENTFNHIEIDQSAPDFFDFFPPQNHEKPRQWWFYNEGDLHRPLQIK